SAPEARSKTNTHQDTTMTETDKKKGADRTQPAVRDEWWTDERVHSYLDMQPSDGEAADFHVLIKAYRGMVPESFGRFIGFFVAAGRNLNETNSHGETALDVVSQHK